MAENSLSDRPFPLKKRYNSLIFPAMILFLLILVGLIAYGARTAGKQYYLHVAQQRAETIAEYVRSTLPNSWDMLLDGELAQNPALYHAVDQAFTHILRPAGIKLIKVYGPDRRVRYAYDRSKLGELENNSAMSHVLANLTPKLNIKETINNVVFYEFYVPIMKDGRLEAVFELYEPEDEMNRVLFKNAAIPAGISLILFIGLLAALHRLVSSAQDHIDERTDALVRLRRRLETFLPDSAVDAAGRTASDEVIPSRSLDCTIMYLDIRDFTGFADANTPTTVVEMLNTVFDVCIREVHAHRGEVDKFIGDAVLAWFDGDDAPRRAIETAQAVIKARPADGVRDVGIGVYSGPAVVGAVGPETRRDFTIIGSTVNMAARLCSAAAGNEVVADTKTLEAAGEAGNAFGPVESLQVKGREQPLSVRRRLLESESV